MGNVIKAVTVLVEDHPRDWHVAVAYLMWEHPVDPTSGLPVFIESPECQSSLDALVELSKEFQSWAGKSLFDFDFSVEHVRVTSADLETLYDFYNQKMKSNG